MSGNQKVASVRKKLGLTQKQFGARIGMSESYIRAIENDQREASKEVLYRVAAVEHPQDADKIIESMVSQYRTELRRVLKN